MGSLLLKQDVETNVETWKNLAGWGPDSNLRGKGKRPVRQRYGRSSHWDSAICSQQPASPIFCFLKYRSLYTYPVFNIFILCKIHSSHHAAMLPSLSLLSAYLIAFDMR
jgi:hypothetical protein